MAKLLIIDDEINVLYSLQAALEADDLEVVTARTGAQALALIADRPDVAILDVRLPDVPGLELFTQIKAIAPRLPVIVITAYATTETAIEAMKRGAFEYLLKPVDLHQLREVVARAALVGRMQRVPAVFAAAGEEVEEDQIVGRSAVMQEVYKTIGRIAGQDVPVLILGESGTGKELVARALYQHSKRADSPFLAINCAAIPEALLESELFGHEKGAFTGADRQRIGKFEHVDGGTLFLDEIGDMSPATQAKMLRLLQEQRFERIGGRESIKVDVRVIAATNQNLDEMVKSGAFRQDLLYRLNAVTIRLPPLRQRKEDLSQLVEHAIRLANRTLEKEVHTMTPEAMALLEAHPWPGNVRELLNVVRYGVIRAVGDVITPECLPAVLQGDKAPPSPVINGDGLGLTGLVRDLLHNGEADLYRKIIAAVDQVVLSEVLRHVNGNQVQASALLGISRTTLRAKLQALQTSY